MSSVCVCVCVCAGLKTWVCACGWEVGGFCNIAQRLQQVSFPSGLSINAPTCTNAHSKHTHVFTHSHTFAAAGDSFLIFHSNSCGLALILASRDSGLKGCLTPRAGVHVCERICLFSCVWHDNCFPCWAEWGVGVTGHDTTEADTADRLTGRTTLKHYTQQVEEEKGEEATLVEETHDFFLTLIPFYDIFKISPVTP